MKNFQNLRDGDEMIRFTSVRIKNIRWSIENNQTSKELMTEMIDEIERLQAENDRLKSDAEQNELILLALHEALKEKQEHVQDLEQELKNKCANCGLASHDIWGDEDNVYDNLTTEEE